jgi:2-polyprenyl-3-methyl-5-hydroxy-6-metoxy-1,4-benzoquinol methylase
MKSKVCHLCNAKLFPQAIMELDGIPKSAQYFPTKTEFKKDSGIELKVYQCSSCGLVQLNIDPVDYFREVITAASFSKKTRLSRFDQMKGLVDRFDLSGDKILEVGSGKGDMLDILKEVGLDAYGIEASAESVEIGKLSGRNMIHGYIGEMNKISGAPFDAFISLNYLEHLPNPGTIIKNIYNNTSNNSVGFVTVPNLVYLLKTKCFYEFVADHLSYFTQETLTYAFESNGFEVLESSIINEQNDIAVIVKKRKSLNISDGIKEVKSLIQHLKEISEKYNKQSKKIAVWGAGHRTLALLALSNLETIEYVVDSAKFKQGRYTPVIHTPIVAPGTLKEQLVDLVIVMVPGLYPGEVLKTLSEMNLQAEIAVLKDNRIEFK